MSDATATLMLHRVGRFKVRAGAENQNQCGRYRGQRTLSFDVEIESHGGCLDEQGFLVDNGAVQSYFDRKYGRAKVFPSCEQIALMAVNDLRKIVGRDRCASVKVCISPGDHARITAHKTFKREEI